MDYNDSDSLAGLWKFELDEDFDPCGDPPLLGDVLDPHTVSTASLSCTLATGSKCANPRCSEPALSGGPPFATGNLISVILPIWGIPVNVCVIEAGQSWYCLHCKDGHVEWVNLDCTCLSPIAVGRSDQILVNKHHGHLPPMVPLGLLGIHLDT